MWGRKPWEVPYNPWNKGNGSVINDIPDMTIAPRITINTPLGPKLNAFALPPASSLIGHHSKEVLEKALENVGKEIREAELKGYKDSILEDVKSRLELELFFMEIR